MSVSPNQSGFSFSGPIAVELFRSVFMRFGLLPGVRGHASLVLPYQRTIELPVLPTTHHQSGRQTKSKSKIASTPSRNHRNWLTHTYINKLYIYIYPLHILMSVGAYCSFFSHVYYIYICMRYICSDNAVLCVVGLHSAGHRNPMVLRSCLPTMDQGTFLMALSRSAFGQHRGQRTTPLCSNALRGLSKNAVKSADSFIARGG